MRRPILGRSCGRLTGAPRRLVGAGERVGWRRTVRFIANLLQHPLHMYGFVLEAATTVALPMLDFIETVRQLWRMEWRRSYFWSESIPESWSPSGTGCRFNATRSDCMKEWDAPPQKTNTTAAAKLSAPPEKLACQTLGPLELPHDENPE